VDFVRRFTRQDSRPTTNLSEHFMATLDLATLLREHADKLFVPGAALMKYGPEDYVGATLVLRGSLYFDGSHTLAVREAVCQCFDQYEAIAKDHLTWLWRDEPPQGPDKFAYANAPKFRDMVKKLGEDDHLGFAYISGKKPHDASPWQFQVSGLRGWEARMGTWGLASLDFSIPPLYVEQHPRVFQELFVAFARLLRPQHGHGGHAMQLSLVRKEPNEPVAALMAEHAKGLDVGSSVQVAGRTKQGITTHIKTIGWLTAINQDMVKKIGGMEALRSELPMNWFALYDYGAGLVIQAGPRPEIAPVAADPMPAIYVLPNMVLKEVRMAEIGDLHYGSKDGEPRLTGVAAEDWLKRFDVPEDQLMAYKAKLLTEPQLTKETTLLDRL
jgi:Protein of unknown function (DUF3396)